MNKYIVYRVYQHSNVKHILYENLTREEAEEIVKASPNEDGSWVIFKEEE
tara:strand:+ start:87 stop:236 length:150 start_codon:yes stop_codon:yes gene_type:complete